MSRIHYATAFEDTPLTLMDRVQNVAGVNITQASMTSIGWSSYEYSTQAEAESDTSSTAISADTALTVSSVVFDTLQTAAPWDSTVDATGYNFKFTLPKAARPTGGKWHRIEVLFTPASGETFVVVWIVKTLALARS